MLQQNISSSFHSLYTPILQNETALVFQANHAFSEKQNVTEVLTMSESSTSQQMKGSVSGKAENASPDETFLDDPFPENAQRYPSQKRVDRPMSAKPTRPIRSLEGSIINKSGARQSDKEWSSYFAGDEVYRLCGVGAMTSYPRPIPMSSNGILEVSSLPDAVAFTPMRYL
uniref:Uncharacterized protein n=1 Tax=Ascaris lumbricoides TaxID=6252 RepID=A0A0M3HUF6_ASCLU